MMTVGVEPDIVRSVSTTAVVETCTTVISSPMRGELTHASGLIDIHTCK